MRGEVFNGISLVLNLSTQKIDAFPATSGSKPVLFTISFISLRVCVLSAFKSYQDSGGFPMNLV